MQSLFSNPIFWLVVAAGFAILAYYMLKPKKKAIEPPPVVRPAYGTGPAVRPYRESDDRSYGSAYPRPGDTTGYLDRRLSNPAYPLSPTPWGSGRAPYEVPGPDGTLYRRVDGEYYPVRNGAVDFAAGAVVGATAEALWDHYRRNNLDRGQFRDTGFRDVQFQTPDLTDPADGPDFNRVVADLDRRSGGARQQSAGDDFEATVRDLDAKGRRQPDDDGDDSNDFTRTVAAMSAGRSSAPPPADADDEPDFARTVAGMSDARDDAHQDDDHDDDQDDDQDDHSGGDSDD